MTDRSLGTSVWRGERGRTEVWYLTATDRATGLGLWVHAETVAPSDGAPAYSHGWVALFPPDGTPVVERFGPGPVQTPSGPAWFELDDVEIGPGLARGRAGALAWDLAVSDDGPPLYTFPRAVWERHLLPGAQVVPAPEATVTGTVATGGTASVVEGPGALARIYGHGSAQRWGWLHAPLEGGGVVEIVTATARRPGLRRLRPLAMVQVRLPGEADWPVNPALASLRFRTRLHAGGFTVRGRSGGQHLDVDVQLPATSRVALQYTDPDGSTATCTNSERSSARIVLRGRIERTWLLDGTAHAEVGARP